MDTLFDLEGSGEKAGSLFCEWGRGFCCMAGIDHDSASVTRLKYFSFEDPIQPVTVDKLTNELRGFAGTEKIFFAFAFPEQVIVPRRYKDIDFVQDLYETKEVMNDHVAEWQLTNQYSIPEEIRVAVTEQFTNAECYHVNSAVLKDFTGHDASEQLIVNISPKDFRVVVKKAGKLQLAQVYHYEAPLDVVYYLLKVVTEFRLNASEVLVVLSGLVEEESSLYKELHQYFHNLRFDTHSAFRFDHPHPAHFFSSVFNLNACVS